MQTPSEVVNTPHWLAGVLPVGSDVFYQVTKHNNGTFYVRLLMVDGAGMIADITHPAAMLCGMRQTKTQDDIISRGESITPVHALSYWLHGSFDALTARRI